MEAYRGGFEALGDPTRRAIFELIADGPRPVGDIADRLPVSRPAVSQHLRVLKDAGLVVDRAAGTRRLYQLDPDGVRAMRVYLDSFWDRALAAFAAAVEQGNVEQGNVEQGNVEQGNVEQGNVEQGNVEQGNVEQGNEEER